MSPEQKIKDHFPLVSDSDIVLDNEGFYHIYISTFNIHIRIPHFLLENLSMDEIFDLERNLLDMDDELTNKIRHLMIRRY